ncbi:MAG: aldehyde dehydrogenase family protein [Pseudomonadota bacterium]|nr:aldehyde dehydrogenase family protein [Pseudomonadota bacterium]
MPNSNLPTAAASTSKLTVVNPFDLSAVETVIENNQTDVEKALTRAYALYRDRPGWPPEFQRLAILEGVATLMEQHFLDLIETAVREGGKPTKDTRAEVTHAIDSVKAGIAALRNNSGESVPMSLTSASDRRMAFTQKEPIGVVVAVCAFSHPLDLIVHQVIPAVAAGCPVIIRPAPETPLSALTFVKLLYEAGLPREWAQTIVTSDDNLTEKLATDYRVGFLTFIGSASIGWMLRSKLAPGTRCTLEHGGVAPVIVLGDSDIYEVREALLKGCFYHAGQICGSVQRIFVHTKIATRFATQLAMKAAGLHLGNPLSEETDVGPLIRPEETDRIHEWVTEAVEGGGQLLTGGEKLTDTIYTPTVIFNPPQNCRLMTEEVFGPVVCIDPWFDVKDALARANSLPTAFQAAIFTRDIERAMEISTGLEASAVMINDHTAFRTGWMPYAGLRQSGLGTNGVPHTLNQMTVDKVIVLRTDSLALPSDAGPG